MNIEAEVKRGRIYGLVALGIISAILVALGYFIAHLPLWACVLIGLASIVVNSFVLRVEDSKSFDKSGGGQ